MELLIVIILYILWVILPFALLSEFLKLSVFIVVFSLFLVILNIVLKFKNKKRKNNPAHLSKEFMDKYPIVIQYTPPKGINSAEAWLLYNCKVEPTDLTSLIYQWACDWLIELEDGDDSEGIAKVILKKLKQIPEDRPFFEKDMFNSIFMWNRTSKVISSSNQLKYALFLDDLQIHGVQKWWFKKKKIPLSLKILYVLLILSTVISLFVKFMLFPLIFLLLVIISWYIFGNWRMQLTDKWAELVSYIIWYRKFIKNCDEIQIKSLLEEDPLFVDKSLPYAIAFGLESQFISKTTPLVEDWNAKYLFWKKVSPLSEIISWISDRIYWIDSIMSLFRS